MKTRMTIAAILAALILAGAPAPAQETDLLPVPLAELTTDRAESVVTVKCVLKVQLSAMGQSEEREQNMEVRGVLVSPAGLVLLPNSAFDAGVPAAIRRMLGDQLQMKSVPSDLMVLFGNEVKEYEAQLVARDSTLDLAFVQILDLEGREVRAADLTPGTATAAIGDEIFAVTRMPRGFDCAPVLHRFHVTSWLEKPRKMWAVEGPGTAMAHPVYDRFGRPVGVLAIQGGSEGVGGEAGLMGMNLEDSLREVILPLDQVSRSLKAAEERAKEALENAGDEPAEEPADEPADEPSDEPGDEPSDEPSDEPGDDGGK